MSDPVIAVHLALPHVAARLFGVPLAVMPARLQTLLTVLGPRFLGQDMAPSGAPMPEHMTVHTETTVAVIPIVGTLVKRAMPGESFSDLTYGEIEASFLKAINDPAISAIVLDVDSPGGEVNGMLDLSDTIFKARGGKPIIVVANELAASAAYAIASAADTVLVSRTGTVGSIGVLAVHVDTSARDAQEGLKFTTMTAGERKADFDPHAPLSDEARGILQAEIDRIYGLFVETVARNRGMSAEAVRKTEAAVYSGHEAVAAGLADGIGTLASAIAEQMVSRERTQQAEAQRAEMTAQVTAAVCSANARNLEIAKLCRLAGLSQHTAEFQERELTAEQVKAELLRRRAQSETEEIHSHLVPGGLEPRGAVISYAAIYGRLRGAQQGRS